MAAGVDAAEVDTGAAALPSSQLCAGLACLLVLTCGAPGYANESRALEVGSFSSVRFTGVGTVHLSQGASPRLTVRGEIGALDALKVETRADVLYIETTGSTRGLNVNLRVTTLDTVVAAGDGRIVGSGLHFDVLHLEGEGGARFELHGLEADRLEVRGRGASRFELSGQVHHQVVQLQGTGAYQATGLISNRTSISVAGASDVRLWADERLDVDVAGSADIRYAGSPLVEQRITGIASVLHIPQIVI